MTQNFEKFEALGGQCGDLLLVFRMEETVYTYLYFKFLCVMLDTKPKDSCMLGVLSTEVYPPSVENIL